MALGDKEYTYAYWGLPASRDWYKTGDSTPWAALVYPRIWSYAPDGIYYDDGMYSNADNNGKPLEDSVSIVKLPQNASYACNACFSVSISNTLTAHYDVNVNNNPVSLAMAAVDVESMGYSNFGRDPIQRYAYDQSNACNGVYTSLIYDFVYNAVCLQSNALIYDRATPASLPQGKNLSSMAAWINQSPDTRDVCVIRPYLYRGTETPRINTAQYMPSQGGGVMPQGTPLLDCLTDWPIPDSETYLKSKLENSQGWRSDKVYAPFYYQLGQNLYSGSGTAAITSQLEIGFTRPFTVTQITTGAATIDSGHKISAQFYRCNYEPKYFEDVVYQWENVIFDYVNGVELQNGMPLSGYAGTDRIRFYTRLKILDYKGNNKGKALELAVKHELAYIGLYFTDTAENAESKPLGTGDGVNVYLPEIVGGVTTGRYYTGDDIRNVSYATANSVSGDAFKYDPAESEESGDSTTIINTGTIGSGATYYALTNAQMNALSTWLNTTYQPTDQDTFLQDFRGTNPADYIASCVYYPFDIPIVTASVPIVVGKLTAGTATGATLAYTYGQLYDYGSYDIPMYGDFRDYMTQITVFVPFCGTVKLDPIMWVGHRLSVKMAIDWPTGVCTGFIYRDSTMYDSVSGTIGVQLPLSAVANGSYQVAITNMLASHKAAHKSMIAGALAVAGGATTAISGTFLTNPKTAVGGLLAMAGGGLAIDAGSDKMENIDYNIDHTQPTVTEVSGGSPFINCGTDLRVKILRTTPMMLPGYDASVYAKTIGFADCRTVKNLSGESGLTVCTNIDTSGLTAPLEVIAELNKVCKEGLIL